MKVGDEVLVLPSGLTSTIAGIDTADGPVDEAFPPMSVTVRLSDEIDISRGDVICRANNHPAVTQDIDAMVCWMSDAPLSVGKKYAIVQATRSARAVVREVAYELDVNTLHRDQDKSELALNSIGRVKLRATVPLVADDYARNRRTGAFILIDESTNATVGAGVLSLTP